MIDDLQNERLCMEAYRSGFNEGQKHTTPSEETLRFITEMKTEWAQMKTRALTMLFGTLALAVTYGIWVGTIQARIDAGEDAHTELTASVTKIDGQQRVNDISLAGIKSELASINATLLEIKTAIKQK